MPTNDRGAHPETATHRALASVTRVRILQLLERGPMDVHALVKATGLHHNTVRQHLGLLERAALVTRSAGIASGPGRPGSRYAVATESRQGRSQELDSWLLEALALAVRDAGDGTPAAVEKAARSVGASSARAPAADAPATQHEEAIRAVCVLLEELGFDPELVWDRSAGGAEVRLRHCPFDDLARRFGDIVCTAHLGLVRGALAGLGATTTADLRPFVEPSLCVVDIGLPLSHGTSSPAEG